MADFVTERWGAAASGSQRRACAAFPADRIATIVSSGEPRPVVSPCQATLSLPSRYRHRPAVVKGSPSSGP